MNAERQGPERSSTAQRTAASQPRGRRSSHRLGTLAVRPATMSNNWPPPASAMLVAQALALNRPRRHIRCSSSPEAATAETRAVSAAGSAEPQR